MVQGLVHHEDGVVDHRPDEDDEAEHGEDVQRLAHEEVGDTKPKETSQGGQRHREHDHERVEEALEQRRHQQVRDDEGQQEVPLECIDGLRELVRGTREMGPVEPPQTTLFAHGREDVPLDELHRCLERAFLFGVDAEGHRPHAFAVVDLDGPVPLHDVRHRPEGDEGTARRGDRELLEEVGPVHRSLLRHDPQIDLPPLVDVVADLGPVHEGAHREAQLAVGQPQLGRPLSMGDDPHLGIVQVETGNRAPLGTRHELHGLAEDLSAESEEVEQIGAGDVDVDVAALVEAPLEDARLVEDDEGARQLTAELSELGEELANPERLAGLDPHERLAVEDSEEAGPHAASGLRQGLGGPGLRLPERPERIVDGMTQLGNLVQAVTRRWEHQAEQEVVVPDGKVLGLGHEQPAQAQRGRGQPHHDDEAQAGGAGDPVDQGLHRPVHPAGDGGEAPEVVDVLRPVRARVCRRGRPQDPRRQAGDHRRRDDQREHHRAADGHGDVAKELAGLLLDEDHGDEDRHRGEGAGEDRAPHLRRSLLGGLEQRLSHLAVAVDVLQDDDGVVHHHPHGESQPGQAHHVQRPSEDQHQEEGSHHADRDGGGDHQRARGTAQKQKQHDHGEQSAHEKALKDEAHGPLHVLRLVVGLDQLETAGGKKLAVQSGDRRLDPVHHLEDVGAGLPDGVDEHHRPAPHVAPGHRLAVAQPRFRHVPQVHRDPAPDGHDDALHVLGRAVLSHRPHHVPALALVEVAAAEVAILPFEGGPELAPRHPARGQLRRVHDHLQLPLAAAEVVGQTDSGDTLELRLDRVLGEIVERVHLALEAVILRRLEDPPPDGPLVGVDSGDHGLVGVLGVARDLLQAVRDLQQRRVDVDPDGKGEGDGPHAVGARALQAKETLEGLELLLLLVHDLPLDLLGAGPGPERAHRDLGLLDGGGQLDGNPEEGEHSEEDDEDHPHRGGDRVADGTVDDLHGSSYSPGSGWTAWPG